jgi:retron-type reverse transcriptase
MKLGLIQPDIQRPTSPRQQQRKRQDPRKSLPVEELARRLRMTPEQLAAFEPSYNEVQIPKKRGGMRKLCVPDAATKSLQRKILHMVLMLLKTHDAATGFDPGVSIAHNAAMHVGQAVVIKLDIKDFFPSTTSLRVEQYFLRIGWNAEAAALLVRLVTYDGGLPQGAPTSPRLSNLVNYTLDCKIMDYVQRHRGTYTRYADDITVSYPEDWPKYVRGTVQRVRSVCRKFDYVVHTRGKLRILRAHQQQRVTGLVVNEKVQLPREKRRWLRAVEHRLRTTGEASLTEEQLAGWQGLQDMIAKQTTPIDNER